MKELNTNEEAKINILYLISSLNRCGPVNVLFSLVSKIDRTKFRPIIITFKQENKESRIYDFENLGIKIIQAKGIGSFIGKIYTVIKNEEVKIVHSHGIIPDFCNLMVSPKKVMKVSTLHNYPFEDYPMTFGHIKGFFLAHFQIYIERRLICVACSASIKQRIKKRCSFDILSISNGVPFNKRNVKRKRGLNFVYLGSVSCLKNVDFLAETFSLPQNSHFHLYIVGDGVLYEKLRTKYLKNVNIKFVGRVNAPDKYLEMADYYISASLSEGMPMSVLEALATGLPILLSDIPSHIKIINSGRFGLSFALGDKIQLSEQLVNISNTNYSSKKIINDAYKLYSDEVMAKQYEKVYLKVLQTNVGGRAKWN